MGELLDKLLEAEKKERKVIKFDRHNGGMQTPSSSKDEGEGSFVSNNNTVPLPKSRFTRKNRRGAVRKMIDYFGEGDPTVPIPTGCDYEKLRKRYENVPGSKWVTESADKFIPKRGFITDFVAATRGLQASTLFAVWSALYTLSAMTKRSAWISWGEDRVFPNLYLVFVAKPGLFKKTTLISYGDDVMTRACEEMTNPIMKIVREPNTIRSEITPEAMHDIMKPQRVRVSKKDMPEEFVAQWHDEESDYMHIEGGSNCNFIVSELSSAINKKQYNSGLVKKLLDLYDCPTVSDRTTRTDGSLTIEHVYMTMFGGTTPDQLKTEFPADLMGSGFMSRTVVVTQEELLRRFSRPQHYDGAPYKGDLAKSLAWIMDNKTGQFEFEPVAEAYIDSWYETHLDKLAKGDESYNNVYSRYDLILRKVSMLFALQRYEGGNTITLEDVIQALQLMNFTYGKSSHTTDTGNMVKSFKEKKRIVAALSKAPKKLMTRRKLYTAVQRYMNSEDLQIALYELKELGAVQFFSEKGEILETGSKNPLSEIMLLMTEEEVFPSNTQRVEQDMAEEKHAQEWEASMQEDNYEQINENIEAILEKRTRKRKGVEKSNTSGYTEKKPDRGGDEDAGTRETWDDRCSDTETSDGCESEYILDDS